MKKLFNAEDVSLFVVAALTAGAIAGGSMMYKASEVREAKMIQSNQEAMDLLSDVANEAYGTEVVSITLNEDGTKHYYINAAKMDFIDKNEVISSEK